MSFIDRPAEQRVTVGPNLHPSNITDPSIVGLGSSTQDSGVVVNHDTAQNLSAVYAAVRFLSDTTASLPLHLYRRDGEKKVAATEHPLYDVLHHQANPTQTAFEWREQFAARLALRGNGLSEIVRDGAHRVRQLWHFEPDVSTVSRKGSKLFYTVRLNEGSAMFNGDDVLHCKLGGGLWGVSPIYLGVHSMGLGLAAQEHGVRLFGNSSSPRGILTVPGGRNKDEGAKRIREQWEQTYGGRENWSKTAVLAEGTTWQQIGLSPEDSQLLESRRFTVTETARWFHVPPHVLADLERATFSNMEQEATNLLLYYLLPWLTRLEQAMTVALLTPAERSIYFIRHDVKGLLRGDSSARAAFYKSLFDMGAMNGDDIRDLEDMDPIEDESAYFLQVNVQTVEQARKPKPIAPGFRSQGDVEVEVSRQFAPVEERAREMGDKRRAASDRMRPIIERAASKLVEFETSKLLAELEGRLEDNDTAGLEDWLAGFYGEDGEFRGEAFDALEPVILALSLQVDEIARDEIGGNALPDEDYRDFVAGATAAAAAQRAKSSSGQLAKIMAAEGPDTVAELGTRAEEWKEKTPSKMGHQISRHVEGIAYAKALSGGGITLKRWSTRGKNCPICDQLDGKVVGVEGSFVKQGEVLATSDPQAPMKVRRETFNPPLHAGCDCQIVAGS